MRKIVVSESVTVDGFVDAERFIPYNSDERNEYMRATVLASDALLVGRTTYELLAEAWSSQKNGMVGGL